MEKIYVLCLNLDKEKKDLLQTKIEKFQLHYEAIKVLYIEEIMEGLETILSRNLPFIQDKKISFFVCDRKKEEVSEIDMMIELVKETSPYGEQSIIDINDNPCKKIKKIIKDTS